MNQINAEHIARNRHSILEQIKLYQSMRTHFTHDVTLLAASKTQSVDTIETALETGQSIFGENYAQEGVGKIAYFNSTHPSIDTTVNKPEWHFIGPIQSNKTKLIAENFHWVHSVDRLKIAERLNHQRGEWVQSQLEQHEKIVAHNPLIIAPLQVLIQINVSEEKSKSGIHGLANNKEALLKLAEQIDQLNHLCLRGIMAIPAPAENYAQQLESCLLMRDYFELLQCHFPFITTQSDDSSAQIDTLSMGMSNDLKAAIIAGTTMVRVGTALFGLREPKP